MDTCNTCAKSADCITDKFNVFSINTGITASTCINTNWFTKHTKSCKLCESVYDKNNCYSDINTGWNCKYWTLCYKCKVFCIYPWDLSICDKLAIPRPAVINISVATIGWIPKRDSSNPFHAPHAVETIRAISIARYMLILVVVTPVDVYKRQI